LTQHDAEKFALELRENERKQEEERLKDLQKKFKPGTEEKVKED